jgi:hypothetical protein
MDSFIIMYFALNLLILSGYSVLIIIFYKKRKELINDYKQLLILKEWYEKYQKRQITPTLLRVLKKRTRSN